MSPPAFKWAWFLAFSLIIFGECLSVAHAAKRHLPAKKSALPAAVTYAKNQDAMALADEIAKQHHLNAPWVRTQIGQAQFLPRVVKLMQPMPPGARKNWATYRSRFVTPRHIEEGAAFWYAHQADFEKAQAQYGVPAHIVLGILGVETIYGRNTGSFKVLDALATLALNYPQEHPRRNARVAYFRGELGAFLALAHQMARDPHGYKGSFAGAMGWPQFMPSSWLKYAVDFDGDGRIDLWRSPSDIIGSIANYFQAHGWQTLATRTMQPIASDATHSPLGGAPIELENGLEPSDYYQVDSNFYVITKYNDSYYYAAAVLELGEAVMQKIQQQGMKE